MGRYICGDSVLRLGAAGDHQPGETFDAQLGAEQEASLAACGAITVLVPSVQPVVVESGWQPPAPAPAGPGEDPKPVVTPAPPADVPAASARRVKPLDNKE